VAQAANNFYDTTTKTIFRGSHFRFSLAVFATATKQRPSLAVIGRQRKSIFAGGCVIPAASDRFSLTVVL
jgi:hypothetical protein